MGTGTDLGSIVLGFPGVFVMGLAWCLAVGIVFLPVRYKDPFYYAIPGPIFAVLLVSTWPLYFGPFLFAFTLTAAVMWPAAYLVPPTYRAALRRSASCIAVGLLVMGIGRLLPVEEAHFWRFDWVDILTLLLGIPAAFAFPIALLLLLSAPLRKWRVLQPLCACALFALGWMMLVLRGYYHAQPSL